LGSVFFDKSPPFEDITDVELDPSGSLASPRLSYLALTCFFLFSAIFPLYVYYDLEEIRKSSFGPFDLDDDNQGHTGRVYGVDIDQRRERYRAGQAGWLGPFLYILLTTDTGSS